MWIFTIIVVLAVGGTAFWLLQPKLTEWIDAPMKDAPPVVQASALIGANQRSSLHRHRASESDIQHHAATLIARIEEELKWDTELAFMEQLDRRRAGDLVDASSAFNVRGE